MRPVLGTATRDNCPVGMVADVSKPICYRLDPAFITESDIETADAVYDDQISRWAIDANVEARARGRYLDGMKALINRDVAIVIDERVVGVFTVNPGITGSEFQISSHENWSMARAVATAAGIAAPSTPACTPTTCTTTTGVLDVSGARCDAVASRNEKAGAVAVVSEISAATLRAAFVRARIRVPTSLALVGPNERLALCTFDDLASPGTATPTTMCPDGSSIPVSPSGSAVAVDADLNAIRPLPAARFLYPGVPGFDSCELLTP